MGSTALRANRQRRTNSFHLAFWPFALVALVACRAGGAAEHSPEQGKQRVVAQEDTADKPLILVAGPARAALDSANALFKAKRYSHALALYREAARLAPKEPSPLLGMLMAATMLEDDKLADSIRVALRVDTSRAKPR